MSSTINTTWDLQTSPIARVEHTGKALTFDRIAPYHSTIDTQL